MYLREESTTPILEVVKRGNAAASGEFAKQELPTSPSRDRGRDYAAYPAVPANDRSKLLGEKLIGLQGVDTLDRNALGAQWICAGTSKEKEGSLDLVPGVAVALALIRVILFPFSDAQAPYLPCHRGDLGGDNTEVLFIVKVNLVPRRVGQHAGEAA